MRIVKKRTILFLIHILKIALRKKYLVMSGYAILRMEFVTLIFCNFFSHKTDIKDEISILSLTLVIELKQKNFLACLTLTFIL